MRPGSPGRAIERHHAQRTPMTDTTITPITPAASTRRLRRVVVALAATVASFAGAFGFVPTTASAVMGGLPTNAMAPVVTTSAREALANYDEWVATQDPAAVSQLRLVSHADRPVRSHRDRVSRAGDGDRVGVHPDRTPTGRARGDDPGRRPVPHEHQPGRRRIRLLRVDHLRVGEGRRAADPSEHQPVRRAGTGSIAPPPRPAISCSTRVT